MEDFTEYLFLASGAFLGSHEGPLNMLEEGRYQNGRFQDSCPDQISKFLSGNYLAVCPKITIFPSERSGQPLPGALGELFGTHFGLQRLNPDFLSGFVSSLFEISPKCCPFCL